MPVKPLLQIILGRCLQEIEYFEFDSMIVYKILGYYIGNDFKRTHTINNFRIINTNFNFKNSNKKNTTEVFGSISGSKAGLRTRVYTQGLDNDRLEVVFNTVDFSYISSNEGAILCSINYDGEYLIKVLNFFSNVNPN